MFAIAPLDLGLYQYLSLLIDGDAVTLFGAHSVDAKQDSPDAIWMLIELRIRMIATELDGLERMLPTLGFS
jgi:hypothetical protein